jgi:thiol:disulfide interchange protein DsbD
MNVNYPQTGHKHMKKILASILFVCALGLPAAVAAIEFDEVRKFEEVFVISGSAPTRDAIEVSWAIEPEYYLYNNRFLRFTSDSEGVVLGEAEIPPGKLMFDDLLGEEIEKYHGRLTVRLPLVSVDPGVETAQLKVRSQGCLEDVLCYPPTEQVLLVSLPPDTGADLSGAATSGLPLGSAPQGSLAEDPLTGLGVQVFKAPALKAQEAFVYEVIGLNADTALVRFTAHPGYYLYRDKFVFRVSDDSGFVVRSVSLPEGVIKDDPEFGPVPVIFDQVEIPVRFNRPAGEAREIVLEADFQGCRDGDICYPPMNRSVSFEMAAASTAIDLPLQVPTAEPLVAEAAPAGKPVAPVSEQDRLARLLTDNPTRAIFAFFIAGLLLAFTPCVFPMVPILSGIIAGQGERLTTARAFWMSLVYVLAMAVTYTVAGVLAGLFGKNLQAVFQNPWIISGFVLIFIALALSMFGFFELQLPGRLQTRLTEASNRQRGGQMGGVAVMGFLSALIVGPCVAPPLMAALIVIGASGNAALGGAALFSLSMGMGLPLILFGVSAGKLVPRAGAWMDVVKAIFGVGLLALAIWMLERILPGSLVMLLWGALALACGVYLGAFDRVDSATTGWKRLWKSLGILLVLLGGLEVIGAAAGSDYWLRPLEALRGSAATHGEVTEASFTRIKSLQDLEGSLQQASAAGQGAMLDFYADWCVECIRMERNTFPDEQVQALLRQMQLLQAASSARLPSCFSTARERKWRPGDWLGTSLPSSSQLT